MIKKSIIPIDDKLTEFYNEIDYQDRIILSAKFGDGKTFFLNEFKKRYEDEYLFITIYPVNYQVAENKDIFEYIKRDILFQLSTKELINDEIDYDTLVKAVFNKENIKSCLSFLGNIANMAGVPGATLITGAFNKISDSIEKYEKEKKITSEYIKGFEDQPGIYDNDFYTQLITECIRNYKNKKQKKVVLIVEDLDRIDPAHLFRILNIFSAHIDREFISSFDNQQEDDSCKNKFCFDKIITVCCYDNTRKIFYHFYGENSDFIGYISKFLSYSPPFFYSLNRIANEFIYEKIDSIGDAPNCKRKLSNWIQSEIINLSLRDKLKLVTDLNKQFTHNLFIEDSCFSHSILEITPILYLLSIYKRLGLNNSRIVTDLKEMIKQNSLLLAYLVGNLWKDKEILVLNNILKSKIKTDRQALLAALIKPETILIPNPFEDEDYYELLKINMDDHNNFQLALKSMNSFIINDLPYNLNYIEEIVRICNKYIK